jgi:long-chain acyl-CoA synthetase
MKLKQMMIVSPYMENIMINTNPFHNFCVALVVAAQIELQSWASQQGIKTTISQICALIFLEMYSFGLITLYPWS